MLDKLTDKSLDQQICDDHRTLGRIAWHLAGSVPEMMSRTGLDFGDVDAEASVPSTAAEIATAYKRFTASLLEQVKAKWDDSALQVENNMYGEQWKRCDTLHILMLHDIHHRGQMTVLMRQAGLIVSDIYGPALEGWAAYKMPVPKV